MIFCLVWGQCICILDGDGGGQPCWAQTVHSLIQRNKTKVSPTPATFSWFPRMKLIKFRILIQHTGKYVLQPPLWFEKLAKSKFSSLNIGLRKRNDKYDISNHQHNVFVFSLSLMPLFKGKLGTVEKKDAKYEVSNHQHQFFLVLSLSWMPLCLCKECLKNAKY